MDLHPDGLTAVPDQRPATVPLVIVNLDPDDLEIINLFSTVSVAFGGIRCDVDRDDVGFGRTGDRILDDLDVVEAFGRRLADLAAAERALVLDRRAAVA